ncbi:COMM domain-containing protein 2-like [Saccoglossus kowalevskii]|uniref:COMM domain-containing protein 2-like n=1 Tax=Saccoglossus kowalevskii TaxID=10224 RepID=A0ABM0MTF0_SACKO|nr:PREDICTED: COMM domain-containing protein 2-like [Saccoglossus kowalevskii]
MLLLLEDEHKEHLEFLTSVDLEVVKEFCRIAMEFIRKGPNLKVYHTAAQKLDVNAEAVQHVVEGLMYLLTECAKLMISEIDFQDSIMTLGFQEDLKQQLVQFYLENRKEIRAILCKMSMDLPHYHNLEWRLDVQLASRSLRHHITPIVTMKLHTGDCETKEVTVLQTDAVNLLHLTQTLQQALDEMKSSHCRRIVRNINK